MWNLRLSAFFILTSVLALTPPLGVAQTVIDTVQAGPEPIGVAVNSTTNKIYVPNFLGSDVTVIDGTTDSTTTVAAGRDPLTAAVNAVTNKIYVVNNAASTVTVIDGGTLQTITVSVGMNPVAIAVNSVTNKIYVANFVSNNVTVIDGTTLSTTNVQVGASPQAVAVNSVTNKIYVANMYNSNVTVIDGATNSTVTVPAGMFPWAVAVNEATNYVYAVNYGDGTVTAINGTTLSTSTIAAGRQPFAVGVNATTNKIFVTNEEDGTVTVIDGATNSTASVLVGSYPLWLAVDPVANKVYVPNAESNSLTVIDGATLATTFLDVGTYPTAAAVNSATNRIYVSDENSNTVSVVDGTPPTALQFVPIIPCRVADTRWPDGPFGGPPIQGGTYRSFDIRDGNCSIPQVAAAYSLNVTVVPSGSLSYLTVWPTGNSQPNISTMNSLDGRIKANAAIVPAGTNGAVSVFASNTTNVVLDVDGYFAPPRSGFTSAFYPLTPCRVVDTRKANGPLGGPYLQGGQVRDFPILEATSCDIPSSATAYSLNFTVVPRNGPLSYLTAWQAGQSQPLTSTLNNLTATIVANAAIVPAGTGGDIDAYAAQDTDLVIDINGYFAPQGTGGLSLYGIAPCRLLDTRKFGGEFSGKMQVTVSTDPCGTSSLAQAFVLNATVVPPSPLSYLTLWPDGENRPVVSTLNAVDGFITSNMATVPTTNGSIDAYASSLTQLVLDISSYFAP